MVVLAGLLSVAALLWPVAAAVAATITVDRTDDPDPTGLTCTAAPNDCSLRAAIIAANGMAGADTIVLASGQTYTLSRDADGSGHVTDSGANNDDLDVTSQITIEGNGATIERSTAVPCIPDVTAARGEFRIFEVASTGTLTGTLTLQDVTVRNGCASGGSPHSDGGAILSLGPLTLTNSTLSQNSAFGGGGGILSLGPLTLTNSTLSQNSAFGGGGIWNSGPLTITDSTISENSTNLGDGGGILSTNTLTITRSSLSNNFATGSFNGGGGIFNAGPLTITDSTLSGNSTGGDGGGIFNDGGTTTITNSTLSNNSADDGGGIANVFGTTTITNSTLSNNSADRGGGIAITNDDTAAHVSFTTIADNSATLSGGGIYVDTESTVTIKNSLVGKNTNGDDCWISGTFTATGVNFDTDGSCPGFTQKTAADLNLGPLQDNGGPTHTHALQAGSAAIDAVPAGQCTDLSGTPVTTDQRKFSRPFPPGGLCDAGAYERGAEEVTLDSFLCYKAKPTKGTAKFSPLEVSLTDQFENKRFEVKKPLSLCNLAGDGDTLDPALEGYQIKEVKGESKHEQQTGVKVTNQLGTLIVDTVTPDRLLVPTAKSLSGPVQPLDPEPTDHFKCYKVKVRKGVCEDDPAVACKSDSDCATGVCSGGFPKGLTVSVADQFTDPAKLFAVQKPTQLCTPVKKEVEGEVTVIQDPDRHLLCYQVKGVKGEPEHEKVVGIHTNNQFGPEQLDTLKEDELCLPSTKTLPAQP
jgi:predicted outer membrane repeat protein